MNFFRHVNEATPFQPNALNESGHFSNIHAHKHGHFPSFPTPKALGGAIFWKFGSFCFANNFKCLACGSSLLQIMVFFTREIG